MNELKSNLDSNRNVNGVKIILQSVYFDSNKFVVKDKSQKELEEVVKLLRKFPHLNINIQGHTDNVGDDDLNMKLPYIRAKEIFNYLLKNNIEKTRLTYEGYGKSRP